MKVILLEDVAKLGRRGSVVEVADGYARNYLLPRKLAVPATEEKLLELKHKKDAEARRKEKELAEARKLAQMLEGSTITVVARAGEAGKLFGSVTNKEIAQAIESTFNISVDRRKIELEEPIKVVGSYPVVLRLHPEVQVRITVEVVTERG